MDIWCTSGNEFHMTKDIQYEVLVEDEIVFSSSDMDTAVLKYNEFVSHAAESGEWISLNRVLNTGADNASRISRRTVLECNKGKTGVRLHNRRTAIPPVATRSPKAEMLKNLGGIHYRDVEHILALRKYAEDRGHCNVPVDDGDHDYSEGLGQFVERLKEAYRKDPDNPLASKVMQVVPESRQAICRTAS
jgi:hypothetical protein